MSRVVADRAPPLGGEPVPVRRFTTLDDGMGGIGLTELLVVLGIVLVIFGGRKLPQLGRDLGSGMREFKNSITGKDTPELPERTDGDDAAEPVADAEVVRDQR